MLGRVLTSAEVSTAGSAPVTVVSHRFWLSRLAGDPAAIGRTVRANGVELTVVGVLPDGFQGTVLGLQFDLWVPATMAPVVLGGSRELDDRRSRGYSAMARVDRGRLVAVEQAASQAMQELAAQYPESNRDVAAEVLPYWRAPRGPQRMFFQALSVLQGLMLVLLLAVCGNTATLLLARSASRQRELAVRLAVGASPWQVARLLLAESVVIGLCGAVLGAMLAAWGVQALRAVPLTTALPIRFQTSVDAIGLAVALALGLACALLVATVPALQALRLDVSAGVSASARTPATRWWRSLAMAGKWDWRWSCWSWPGCSDRVRRHPRHRSRIRARGRPAGRLRPLGARRRRHRAACFVERALDPLRQLPGVQDAAMATSVPLDIHGLPLRSFALEGRPRPTA